MDIFAQNFFYGNKNDNEKNLELNLIFKIKIRLIAHFLIIYMRLFGKFFIQ